MLEKNSLKSVSRRDFLKFALTGMFSLAFGDILDLSKYPEALDIQPALVVDNAIPPFDAVLKNQIGDGSNPGGGYRHLQPTVNQGWAKDGGHHIGADFNLGKNDQDCQIKTRLIANGVCVFTGNQTGRDLGNVAIFCHKLPDSTLLYSRYAHLHSYFAEVGKEYAIGEVIGLNGKSGWENGHCHLHLDVATRACFEERYTSLYPDLWWYPYKAPTWYISLYFIDPVKFIEKYMHPSIIEDFMELPQTVFNYTKHIFKYE